MPTDSDKPASGKDKNFIHWVLLSLIIIAAAIIRIRLLDFPLERDEGEYAYCGQLILQWIPPFKAAYTMKLPGTGLAYAFFMLLFGQTAKGIHLGLLMCNSLTIILLFQIARRWLNPETALVACLSYAVLSVSPTVLGFAAHSTHFIVFFALAGIQALLSGLEKERWALYGAGGFLLGLAFLMKQQALFFALFGVYLIFQAGMEAKPLRMNPLLWRFFIFTTGAVLPLIVVLAIAWLSGSFEKFWFWTFTYASKYASTIPLSWAFHSFVNGFRTVSEGFVLLWAIALFGLICLFIDPRQKKVRWPILAFVLLSFGAVCPGFYFREHYFVVFLPALALLIGIAVDYLRYSLSSRFSYRSLQYIPLLVFLSAVAAGIHTHKDYFLFEKPEVLCRTMYGGNPFLESIEIAKFLESRTNPGDKIAVLGSEPQILFYSRRTSATGHIYMYGLMETHGYHLAMQRELIEEIEQASPKYLLFVNVTSSWLKRPESATMIFTWLEQYTDSHYEIAGIVDRVSLQEARYIWGDAARTYEIRSPFHLLIFERRRISS